MAAPKKPAKDTAAGAKMAKARKQWVPTRTAFLSLVARAEKSKNNPSAW